MVTEFKTEVGMVIEECCACHMQFGMTREFYNRARENGTSFHCPQGHAQHYTKTEIRKLKEELDRKNFDLKRAQERGDRWYEQNAKTERRLTATRGVVTRIKNRVGHGVCPCCNRTFKDLARHMEGQHPGYAKDVAEPEQKP